MDNTELLNTLSNTQALLYNEIVIDFTEKTLRNIRPKGYLRLGQAFYNYGYYKGIFKGSFPELFYCEDNNEARNTITICLVEYVKGEI